MAANPTVTVTMSEEARQAFQTLGRVCEHLHMIRGHVDRMAAPTMSDQEMTSWAVLTSYLDAVGAPPRQLQPASEYDAQPAPPSSGAGLLDFDSTGL